VKPLLLFMGLLVLAYIGSFLVGERRIRGFGLPSGAEYLILGFVLGPSVSGLLDRSTLETFDPIAHVALGWIALVIGLGFGADQRRATRPGRLLLGALASLATAAAVAAPLWFAVTRFTALRGDARLTLVAGAALACSETTRESVRWVAERYGASGTLSSIVSDLARSDDIVPLTLLAVCCSFSANGHLPWPMLPAGWTGVTLGLGVVFGGTAALIIGRDLRTDETWGTLLGLTVLGVGITTRLGLSTLSAMFTMGIATALFSGHRQRLLAMVEPTERTVLHPVLLLAGARINLHVAALPVLIVVALVARAAAKCLIGLLWQGVSSHARKAGPLLGLGLMSAGTLCMTVGLAFAMRFPGVVGDTVLAVAAAATVLGEFVGPFALHASLHRAGEAPAVTPAPTAVAEGR
jgi:Kef-type K+ transport system membrane component KefB